MEDYIVRATAAEGTVVAFAAVTTNMISNARDTHELSPVASAALGRTLTAAAIMSKALKNPKDTITIQIKGDGPLGGIVVVTDSNANVRGYVYNSNVYIPLNELGKLDVSGAVGKNGYINVIKDFGLKEPYIGFVNLASGEIGDDLAYYMAYSEQIPSIIALGVLVDSDGKILFSGGYIIQLMPGADNSIIDYLESKIQNIPQVTQMLSEGKLPERILEEILGEKGLKITEKTSCAYKCNCSRDRMERNMISLGNAEIVKIINEQHSAETQCHFCNKKYNFNEKDLLELIDIKDE